MMKSPQSRMGVLPWLCGACWCVAAGKGSDAAASPPRHPFLVTTPQGLELAKKRVREEAWAERLLARIAEQARQLESEPLPVFDKEWWKAAGAKRMQDIYPEVHRHAGEGVGRPMQGLTDAAIAHAITGDRRYAETARKILRHYATYEFEARHPDVGMTWGGWGMAGLRTYDFFIAPIATLFPDETLPTVGDTYGRRKKLTSSQACFEAYNAFPDPRLGWVLRAADPPAEALFLARLPSGGHAPPEMKTRVWPEHGFVALRSQEGADYWKGEGYSAFLSFDLNGIHSHRDKFGLTVHGRQAHLAIDPEANASALHAFSARIQNELNRETVCHNTLMVDGQNHGWLKEKLVLSDFKADARKRLEFGAGTALQNQRWIWPRQLWLNPNARGSQA